MNETGPVGEEITLDDIKHKAEGVRDMAVSQARDAGSEVTQQDWTKVLIVAGVGLGVLFSFAYYLGSRAGKATAYEALEDFGRAYD
jgi:hypothetical protein